MPYLKRIMQNNKRTDKSHILNSLFLFALFSGAIIFWEMTLHLVLFKEISARVLYVLIFSVFFGGVFTFLTSIFQEKVNTVILWISLAVLYLWYTAQLIYYKIFGDFISLYLVKMGGDAVTNFFKETMNCVISNLWLIIILSLPFFVCGIALKKKWIRTERQSIEYLVIESLVCVLIFASCFSSLYIGGTGAYSIYDIYHNNNTPTDISIRNLGFLTTFQLELKGAVSGSVSTDSPSDDIVIIDQSSINNILGLPSQTPSDTGSSDTNDENDPSDEKPPIEPIKYYDQVMEIDFDALIKQAEKDGDDELLTMHKYFSSVSPSKTNDYTGMFKGKNLIYMVCESFSPVAISEELTPTLYKLYSEGFNFSNFYGSFRTTTTNGEYTACLGIFPDMSRYKTDGSFNASRNNYLPFALGNIFKSQLGVDSYAYHNYLASYYNRKETHPNLGYSLKAMNSGLKFTSTWPSSDYEMMQQSLPDFISNEQFHAYYMTFSGHYEYKFESNPIAKRNQALVDHLPYTETAKAYLACHIELDKAMEHLMSELEAAGKLEDTVIVMTTDHYPYGLTNKAYNELTSEKKEEDFGIYENVFICWSYDMEEQIVVDTPCSTVDILPTLLNLFGFEYDSRLLMGTDILDPTSFHVAILYNRSFITDKIMFNSTKNEVKYLVDPDTVPKQYLDVVNNIVKNKFSLSTMILNRDYYRIVLPNTQQ